MMVMLAGARGFADAFGRTGLVLWILACMFTLVLDLVFVSLFLIRKPTIIEADANGLRVSQEDSKRVRNWPREKITRISVIPVSVLSNLAVHIGYDWPVRIAFWHDHRELRSVAAALNAALRIESTR
ncbi:MAG TPA: hypothetical protein VL282_14100 [Tepidisphaeraceae bacterium]|nr:hypothetical protein [Tepidisphaeraceae bacterium]